MVAICSTTAFGQLNGILSTSAETLRQSSLRSVTSTHSRQSLIKQGLPDISDTSYTQRRVQFACRNECEDSSESLDFESVIEFDVIDPLEPIYLTASEILKIRSDARLQASHFAQVYPAFIAEINFLFENGGRTLNLLSHIKKLRSRRRRLDPYDIALDSDDRDLDAFIAVQNDFMVDEDFSEVQYYDDETFDDLNYFCSMRGLESRISPLFRLNRRMTIRNVINLQTEMKKSRCSPTQIQMGLRAVSAQGSQKARSFAYFQATLDEFEVVKF